jgi:hypothetical protein
MEEEVNPYDYADSDENGDGRQSGPANSGFTSQAVFHLVSLLI